MCTQSNQNARYTGWVKTLPWTHCFTRVPDTFEQLADMVLGAILGYAAQATRVDFVGDQYLDMSIKNVEWERRQSSVIILFKIHAATQPCPRQ